MSFLQAIVANSLTEGEVVFLGAAGDWVKNFSQAKLYEDAAEAQAAEAAAKAQVTTVVDAYAIDVRLDDGVPVPISYRERVKALGPTIHPDMGKQTEGGPVIEAIAHAAGAARSTGRLGLIRRK
jgi:sulfite reductase (NADPH) hemoprotein beta-component